MDKFKIFFPIIVLVVLILVVVWRLDFSREKMEIGVTFSKPYAEALNLNWPEVYLAVLDDLEIKKLRLSAYWPEIEPRAGEYDFTSLDWQLEEAEKRGLEVILVIGRRLPRWPECHDPKWIAGWENEKIQMEILNLLKVLVERYKGREIITAWQVENEPLLDLFGECPKAEPEFLAQEVELVHSLDRRPVIITDSGELSTWLRSAKYADVFGTTIYRVVWNKYWGYFTHFYPPAFYKWRVDLVQKLYKVDRVIISELQGEPWIPKKGIPTDISLAEQIESFDLEQLRENIDFAQRSGFTETYLWGAEWWYWLKLQGEDSFWQEVKNYEL